MENVVDELFLLIILHQNSLHLCQLDLLQKLIKMKTTKPSSMLGYILAICPKKTGVRVPADLPMCRGIRKNKAR